ncbi:cytokine receptor family member b2 precursor [Silurus asotus]|uniref:Cytokine receptor family member b2 n=1 Tax=Silurus asotus TaxID=30991 RepID=A0AAD5B4G6_SILAS|nr:cytokine receptor family member b2 precursor [Silurus asotus]
MDHVYTLLMLIVSCSVFCGHVPAPINLKIESRHFIHLLTWQAGPGSPSGLQYRVIFRNYKNDWKTVDNCTAVRFPLLCNLTDVLSDLEITYYINVTAVSGNKTSTPSSHPPFIPVSDTELEPPPLQVLPCNLSLCVHLHSPSERLETVYKKFTYQLNVTSNQGHTVGSAVSNICMTLII